MQRFKLCAVTALASLAFTAQASILAPVTTKLQAKATLLNPSSLNASASLRITPSKQFLKQLASRDSHKVAPNSNKLQAMVGAGGLQYTAARIESLPTADITPTPGTSPVWIETDPVSTLISALPVTSPTDLLEEMGKARNSLQSQQRDLAKLEESKRLTVTDGVITAVLPGGLIYAAVRKTQHMQSVKNLDGVTAQLKELNQELAQYRATQVGDSVVALR